ncbi:MAG: GIY-YIG nuclease family protein [Burkholderiales bacterium]|nr:GIY-YIG nuclease family protein [Burkholderiales bacterium]
MTPMISYQLAIDVQRPVRIRIGCLGCFLFPAGRYVYTGSAKRNLEARIARHLRKNKALRWHIDWMLAAQGVEVAAVERSRVGECTLNQTLPGAILVPGFGASDCRKGCGSHLRYLGAAPVIPGPKRTQDFPVRKSRRSIC